MLATTPLSSFKIALCLLLLVMIRNVEASFVKSSSLHGNGDVVLTGLVNVHRAAPDNNCGDVRPWGAASVAAFLYAVDVVNKDPSLLTNITLGYDIYDTCGSVDKANELAFSFARRNDILDSNSSRKESCQNETTPVSVVITEIGSTATSFVASMLQVRSIPLISADATSEELNDPLFKTFFRTIPSDAHQARAIADLIEQFKWTYVGIIAGDESYGQYGAIALEDEAYTRQSFCIAFFESVSHHRKNKLKQVIRVVKRNVKVKVIVLWVNLLTATEFMNEANKQELFGRTWIATDSWSQASSLFSKNFQVVRGFLGTNFRSHDIPPFRHYVNQSLSNSSNGPLKNTAWWKEYWNDLKRNCTGRPCGNGSTYSHLTDKEYEQMRGPYLGFLIDTIQAAARAIDAFCRHGNDLQCANVKGADLLAYLKQVSFTGITGNVQLHNKGRKSAAKYDILNLQRGPNGTPVLKTVGSWDGAKRERLVIRHDLLIWPNESRAAPKSVCSFTCPPGTMQTTAVSCCWDCLPCTGRRVNGEPGSLNCTRCARDQKPNKAHTACEKLPDVGLKWTDGIAIGIAACVALGVCLVAFVLITYLRFRATPVVKSSNPDISYCLMIGIILGFTSAVISLLPPGTITCYAASALYSLYLNTCVSVLFLKTNRILHIFKLSLLSSAFTRWCCDGRNQFILLAMLNLAPLSLLALWMVFDPPQGVVLIVPMQYQYLECRMVPRGVAGNFSLLVFIYILIVSLVCTFYAFKARKLPGNFNEAKFITFAMCIQLMCVISSVTVYGSLSDSHLVEFDCSIKLLSAFGFLLCLFGPKIYVIYRHPEKNTTEYVKSVVANHTLRSSAPSGVNVGPSDRDRLASGVSAVSAASVVSAVSARRDCTSR